MSTIRIMTSHVDAGDACSLYDDKLHETIAADDPEEE